MVLPDPSTSGNLLHADAFRGDTAALPKLTVCRDVFEVGGNCTSSDGAGQIVGVQQASRDAMAVWTITQTAGGLQAILRLKF